MAHWPSFHATIGCLQLSKHAENSAVVIASLSSSCRGDGLYTYMHPIHIIYSVLSFHLYFISVCARTLDRLVT